MKNELQSLQNIESSRLRFTASFEEFGDTAIQLSAGVWPDLVSTLFKVNVILLPEIVSNSNANTELRLPPEASNATIDDNPAPGELNPRSIPFFVKLPTGKTLSVRGLHSASLVRELQVFLYETADIPPWHSMIVRGGKRLDENKSLSASGVKRDCTLHVVLRAVDATMASTYLQKREAIITRRNTLAV